MQHRLDAGDLAGEFAQAADVSVVICLVVSFGLCDTAACSRVWASSNCSTMLASMPDSESLSRLVTLPVAASTAAGGESDGLRGRVVRPREESKTLADLS